MKGFIEYFMPEGLEQEDREKFSFSISFALAVIILIIIFAPGTFVNGLFYNGVVSLAAAAISFVGLFVLKGSKSTQAYNNFLLFVMYCMLAIQSLFTGGFVSPLVYYIIFAPMMAMIINNRNSGLFWSFITALTYILFLVKSEYIRESIQLYDISNDVMATGTYMIGIVGVIAALTTVLISIQNKIKQEVLEAKAGIEIKVQEATEELRIEKEKSEENARKEIERQNKEADYVNNYIGNLLNGLDKFSNGDLTSEINSMRSDNIENKLLIENEEKIVKGFNEAVNRVKQTMEKIIEVVLATASASAEISSSTEEMAAGAQEQSAQTTEVASAIEEMTTTIFETTRNASSAAETAKQSGEVALEGGSVVKQTVEGMNRIADVVSEAAKTVEALGHSSEQIGEIIQVIDDIADQTNLLALNAAIEAARAGEQGRGFAVVADEVRKLAERTTKATKEITDMIKQIQGDTEGAVQSMSLGTAEVESGKKLAQQASEALKEIIFGAEKVGDAVQQVATASEEQSATAEEISKSIEAINSVIQESASGIQVIAQSSTDLSNLTEKLQSLITQFNIGGTGRGLVKNRY